MKVDYKIHELKLMAKYWDDAVSMRKPFEIRKNDRNFEIGDFVELNLVTNSGKPVKSPQKITRVITSICDYMQQDGYVVLGLMEC